MKAGRAPCFPPNYVTLKQLHDQRLKEKQEAEERLRKEKEEEEARLRQLKELELEAEAEAERRRIQRREEEENLRKSATPRPKRVYRRRPPVPALAPIATAEAAKPASGGPDPNSPENLEEESIVPKSRGVHGSKKSYRPRWRTPVAPPAEPAGGALDRDPGSREEALDRDPGAGEEANQLELKKEWKRKYKKKQKKGKAVAKKPEEAIDSKQVVPAGEPVEIVVEEFGALAVNGGDEIPDEEKNGERNPRFGGFGGF